MKFQVRLQMPFDVWSHIWWHHLYCDVSVHLGGVFCGGHDVWSAATVSQRHPLGPGGVWPTCHSGHSCLQESVFRRIRCWNNVSLLWLVRTCIIELIEVIETETETERRPNTIRKMQLKHVCHLLLATEFLLEKQHKVFDSWGQNRKIFGDLRL